MAVHHAVLALLADGPSHGYELKAAFERTIGPEWGTLNVGQLYQVLGRLSADGLIVSDRQPQQRRPDRVVHALTERGRQELATWLHEPTVRQHGYRDDFFLKLATVWHGGDRAELHALIGRQRAYLLGEMRNLSTGTANDDPLAALLIDAARLHLQADFALLDRAEDRLRQVDGPTRSRSRLAEGSGADEPDGTAPGRPSRRAS